MDSNINKLLKENEFNFCRHWNYLNSNIENKFFTIYSDEFSDDYFINRTVINENFEFKNEDEIEKKVDLLIKTYKNKKIFLHLPSNQTNLEKYLIKRKYPKIDEVIGLQYSFFSSSNLLDFKYFKTEFSKNIFQRIFILDNIDQLNKWINTYCSSFEIHFNKRQIIYKILKEKFDIFYFILSAIYFKNMPFANIAGCCILFSYKSCMAMYCLGTLKKYRNRNVARNIIDFAIRFAQRKGCQIFGLQTLQSDHLVSFYEKKGFTKIYTNNIYQLNR